MNETCSSKKDSPKRAGIGQQIPAIEMIEKLQNEMRMINPKNREWEKYHVSREKQEIKAINRNYTLYYKFISEKNDLKRENEKLKKINEESVRSWLQLKIKHDRLHQKLIKLNNRPKKLALSRFVITTSIYPEKEEALLKEEERFKRDMDVAIAESMEVHQPDLQGKSDQYLKQKIDFALELSRKDDEIRRWRENSLALWELFRNNVQAERDEKRKLEKLEIWKENVTDRLTVLEQQKKLLVAEREKLVEQLECTTLCGFCAENMKNAAFEPCGHIWACASCVKTAKMTNCPTCREEILNFRKVFIA